MGKKLRQKKFEFKDDEDKLQIAEERGSKSAILLSSDDEEANEDLSLKIVEKAMLQRAVKLVPVSDGIGEEEAAAGTSNGVIAVSEVQELGNKKIPKKRKKKVKKLDIEAHNVVVTEGDNETTGALDQVDSVELITTEITNNTVFRKLIRGPRYFDPPNSWGACFNCGEEGHNAVNCTSAKRKKPCFVCGSLEHNVKNCSKARVCYNCKKTGHRSKDCPEKHRDVSSSSKVCLKCGDSGHEMFTCQNNYSNDDLKNIQCYICKNFGHLCCVNSAGDTPIEVSCYKCGQIGHTGLACSRLRGEASSAASPSSCYKCGEAGHFARECTSSIKACSRLCEEASPAASPSSCYKCGEEGHFARDCTSLTKASTRLQAEASAAASPSSCYKCGEGGHFARECTSSTKASTKLQVEASAAASPSSCYKCGEGGHFARECTSSTKASSRLHVEASPAASPSSCYKCGEGGHFARECTNSTKLAQGGKRNRDLSNTKLRSQIEEVHHLGSKSAPHDLGKGHKKKKPNYDEKGTTSPWKSGHRGRWMMEEDSQNFSSGMSRHNNWNSPVTPSGMSRHNNWNFPVTPSGMSRHNNWNSPVTVTPSGWNHYNYSEYSNGHYATPQSSAKMHALHPGTPMSMGSSRPFQNRFSASRFGPGDYSNDGRRSYGWW